jgi:hypothetical protein
VGYLWEEEVLRILGDAAVVADGKADTPLRDRAFGPEAAGQQLASSIPKW